MPRDPDDIFKKKKKLTKKEQAVYLLQEALSKALKHYSPDGKVTEETTLIRIYFQDQIQKVTGKRERKFDPKKIIMGQKLLKNAKIGIQKLKL